MDSAEFLKMICGECAIPFYMLADHHALCKCTGKTWYCPNGHARYYEQTKADKLQRQLDSTERARQNLHIDLGITQNARDHHARSAAAYKGQATRLRNKYEPKEDPNDE